MQEKSKIFDFIFYILHFTFYICVYQKKAVTSTSSPIHGDPFESTVASCGAYATLSEKF